MICESCKNEIEAGEERDHHGRMLCEDCYMDALSPTRTCDPWAVHTAKNIPQTKAGGPVLTEGQEKVLSVLEETGGLQPQALQDRLGLSAKDMERDLAALRHMEKLRGELRDGQRYIVLW